MILSLRSRMTAGMTWWGKALPRGRLPPPPPASPVCAFQLFYFRRNRYAVDIFPDGNRQNPRNPSFFLIFFSVKTLANPYKIRYIQKVGFIGALYERG